MRKPILLCVLLCLAAVLLCICRAKRLPEGVSLESLRYETRGMMAGAETALSILRDDEGYALVRTRGWGEPAQSAQGSAQIGRSAADILRKYNVLSWDGFSGHDPMILDGESFTLRITFDDGTTISARGTNASPKEMRQALREIENLFDQLAEEPEQ